MEICSHPSAINWRIILLLSRSMRNYLHTRGGVAKRGCANCCAISSGVIYADCLAVLIGTTFVSAAGARIAATWRAHASRAARFSSAQSWR